MRFPPAENIEQGILGNTAPQIATADASGTDGPGVSLNKSGLDIALSDEHFLRAYADTLLVTLL